LAARNWPRPSASIFRLARRQEVFAISAIERRRRRRVGKVEHNRDGTDPRFAVTSLARSR
jgi:hypothetical protein